MKRLIILSFLLICFFQNDALAQKAYAFGYNYYGQLGDSTTTSKNTPVQIGKGTNWTFVSCYGNHTLAIKSDGTLWAWGVNNYGQLGDGTTTNRHSPVQIGMGTNWASVSGGGGHTLAIKTDGTLWAWGYNNSGQLGTGTTSTSLTVTPVQIGSGTNWASVSSGDIHTLAIKTDGTLWAWGWNYYGQLGDSSRINRTSPIQIGTGTNWASVSCWGDQTLAIKSDGTLWAWGRNHYGQLGDGTTIQRNSPVQIGSGTNWASVSCGSVHTLAVKTNGTLWAWGRNNYGELGDSTTTQRNAPVPIGTETNWASVSCGVDHTLAIKTDGTLWAWGMNGYGQLGDGTTIQRTSPVQIGTVTNWGSVDCGAFHSIALERLSTQTVIKTPVVSLSRNVLNIGDDLTVSGTNFTPSITHKITQSLRNGSSTFSCEANAQGSFTLNITIGDEYENSPGIYNIYGSDASTRVSTARRNFEIRTSSSVDNFPAIFKPQSGDVYYTGMDIDVVWQDKLIVNSSYPVSGGRRSYSYNIYYSSNNGTSWTYLQNESGSGLRNEVKSFGLLISSPAATTSGKIRIVDEYNTSRTAESGVFVISAVSASSVQVSKQWDHSALYSGARNGNPKGVAADGVSRIYLKLVNPSGNTPITSVTAAIYDNVSDQARTVGKLALATATTSYSTEANTASSRTVTNSNSGLSEYWFWYVAPDDFTRNSGDENAFQRTVRVQYTVNFQNGTTQTAYDEIRVIRPPLMLIHGLGDDSKTWDEFRFTSNGGGSFKSDYRWILTYTPTLPPAEGFLSNAKKLLDEFDILLKGGRTLGYAVNQVDYICHSMGGSILRTCVEMDEFLGGTGKFKNYGKGFVNKFITLNTPHNGSPWAEILDSAVKKLDKFPDPFNVIKRIWERNKDKFLLNLIEPTSSRKGTKWIVKEALKDLGVDNGKKHLETDLPSYLIAGDIFGGYQDLPNVPDWMWKTLESGEMAFDFWDKFIDWVCLMPFPAIQVGCKCVEKAERVFTTLNAMVNYYNGIDFLIDSDLIVSVNSQLAGLQSDSYNVDVFDGVPHAILSNSPTSNTFIGNKVFQLLNRPVSSSSFDTIPATPTTRSGQSIAKNNRKRTNYTDDNLPQFIETPLIQISEPQDSTIVKVDSLLKIVVNISDTTGLSYIKLFYQNTVILDTNKTDYYEFNIQTDGYLTGWQEISAHAVYLYSDTSIFIYDVKTVNIQNDSDLVEISASPEVIEARINEKKEIDVTAYFSNYIVDISNDSELDVTILDTTIARYDSSINRLIGMAEGTTDVIIEYNGKSDTIYVVVEGILLKPDSVPILINPNNNAISFAGDTLRWEVPENTVYTKIEIASDSSFADLVFEEEVFDSSETILELLEAGIYYWRAKAVGFGGETDWSEVWSFTIKSKTAGKTLHSWGLNNYGELGDSTTTQRNAPVQIGIRMNWASVSCGEHHTLAMKSDGTLWAWGSNYYGQLGDSTTTNRTSPVQIGTGTNWKFVSGGASHTLAIKTDGTLWSWGTNYYGQLGDGTTTSRISPVQIGTGTNWKSFSCGYVQTLAIKTDGTLWAWGSNWIGQLGDGTTTDRTSPVQIGTGTNWASLSCGYEHTLAIKTDGTLWAWGRNDYGQLGDSTTTSRTSPVQIGTGTNWASVSCGSVHTLAIKTDGTLWAWGRNEYGQLGDSTTTSRTSPVQIGTGTNWASVSCGWNHTITIKTDGTLWAWGYNESGQLGDSTTTSRTSPVQIGTRANWASVSCGREYTVALQSNEIPVPELVSPVNNTENAPLTQELIWESGSVPEYYHLQVSTDGDFSELLVNSAILTSKTYTLENLTHSTQYFWRVRSVEGDAESDWSEVWSFTTLSDAKLGLSILFGWGWNGFGQIGDSTTTQRNIPVQIGTGMSMATVSCGEYHTLSITASGMLCAWGYNGNGQLGDGSTTQRNFPVQIGTGTNWRTVSCGAEHSLGIKTDGTLWAWGNNENGQLGDGSSTQRNFPVQIGTGTNWSKVSCGANHTLGIKTDGTLWAWGANWYGQLGDSTSSERTLPIQIGIGTNWASVSCGGYHTLAIKTDGTLWAWGYNGYGQLGDGTITNRTTPIQIGNGTNWSKVSCGYRHTIAMKTNQTLWAWGWNAFGQLGDGTTTNKITPIQIGNGTNWSKVSCGYRHTIAIKSNQTLWAWGYNEGGQLGDGSTTQRTFPIQIGNGTNWSIVSCGGWYSFAMQSFEIPTPELVSPANNTVNAPLTQGLTWGSVQNAEYYYLQVSENNQFSSFIVDNATLTNTNFSLSELDYSTQYFWRVRTVVGDETSDWSDVWNFTTLSSAPDPSGQAYGIYFSKTQATSTRVLFNRGSGDGVLVVAVQGNQITANPQNGTVYTANSAFGLGSVIGGSPATYAVYSGTSDFFTITGLNQGSIYTFKVYEYSIDDSGNYIYNLSDATGNPRSKSTILHAPVITNISDKTNAKFTAHWTYSGSVEFFELDVASDIEFTNKLDYYDNADIGNVNSFVIPRLDANANYYVRVRAIFGSTISPWSNIFEVSALSDEPTGKPTSVTITRLNANTVQLNWSKGNNSERTFILGNTSAPSTLPSDNTGYVSDASFTSGQSSALGGAKVLYSGYDEQVTITNLSPSTDYFFALFAFNGDGGISQEGDISLTNTYKYLTSDFATCTIKTFALEPTVPPSDVSFSNIESYTLTTSFSAGNGDYHIIVANTVNEFSPPIDGVTYIGNTDYTSQSSSQLGSAKVLYVGTNTAIDVTGLQPSTRYYFAVYAFNGTPGIENYNQQAAFGNALTRFLAVPLNLVITSIPETIESGGSFSITVESQDANGSPTTPLNDISISIGTNGEGTLSGTSSGVISNTQSQVTITGIIYSNSGGEANVGITVSDVTDYHYSGTSSIGLVIASEPSQVTGIASNFRNSRNIALQFTGGSGGKRIIICKQGQNSLVSSDYPSDGNFYSANTDFSDAPLIGSNGAKIVYNGSETDVTISGLDRLTYYTFGVFEYAGVNDYPASINFNVSANSGNIYTRQTLRRISDETGNDERIESSLSAPFPNPVNKQLNTFLELASNSIISANIVDATGKSVAVPFTDKEFMHGESRIVIPLESYNLSDGAYTLMLIVNNEFILTKAFIYMR